MPLLVKVIVRLWFIIIGPPMCRRVGPENCIIWWASTSMSRTDSFWPGVRCRRIIAPVVLPFDQTWQPFCTCWMVRFTVWLPPIIEAVEALVMLDIAPLIAEPVWVDEDAAVVVCGSASARPAIAAAATRKPVSATRRLRIPAHLLIGRLGTSSMRAAAHGRIRGSTASHAGFAADRERPRPCWGRARRPQRRGSGKSNYGL